ncbi:polysaccharide biosynthesis/export family protein [Persicirhabdus sediminis]|uniref:SLBB domain-containing protein n=1 Tax=Persicirhabdus sediminis TaxID=454144 RepID=A0A8J7MC62_9BACT|nr:SLBB domain-containing protein [Persicirhabdus sediminis]MBK1790422.1 SLBB domain-containing protein [Persicirhabdus sediminis]
MKMISFKSLLTMMLSMVMSLTAMADTISTGEMLNISIRGVPGGEQTRITGQYVVSTDGLLYLPLLEGGIKASGRTSSSLSRSIEAAYKNAEVYTNPRITVISNKNKEESLIDRKVVTVGGHVKRPGPVPYLRGMTLYEAVTAAGGETAFGSIQRVELFRKNKRYVYDLRKTAHKGLKIYEGDNINIPQKDWLGN